jgi:cation-transporting ATPase E
VTLVSSLAIGIPGFFLALGPNSRRFEGGFVRRVLSFAVPAGAVVAAAVMAAYGLARAQSEVPREARTAATIVFLMASLWVLVVQARPLQRWKVALVGAMAGLSALSFAVPFARDFFDLELPSPVAAGQFLLLGAAAAAAIEVVARLNRAAGASRRCRRWEEPLSQEGDRW